MKGRSFIDDPECRCLNCLYMMGVKITTELNWEKPVKTYRVQCSVPRCPFLLSHNEKAEKNELRAECESSEAQNREEKIL